MGIDVPDYAFSSEPESMKELLAHIHGRYGEITHYLLQSGLSSDEVAMLKNRMIQ